MEATLVLLRQWHAGDRAALDALVERHLPSVRAQVEKRLGSRLRRQAEAEDFVQDVMVEFLRFGPRFQVNDDEHFRRLLARIVENVLRGRHDWYTAERRNVAKARPIPSDTVLQLDPPRHRVDTPSGEANRIEEEAWVRLALELLSPAQRDLIVQRQWDELPFAAIGRGLAVTEEAARHRYVRAMGQLSKVVGALRRGEIGHALDASEAGDADPDGGSA